MDEFAKANSSQDVISIVPVAILHKDQAFATYLRTHNERLAVRQSTYLQKYLTFTRNNSLIDNEQGILRDECLKYWLVPNKSLSKVEHGADRQQIDPDNYFGRFTKKIYGREDFNARLPQFTMDLLTERIPKQLKYAEFSLNILSNRATTQPELLISTGDAVFVWKKYWEKLRNNIMRIPDRTVLLVERAATYKLLISAWVIVLTEPGKTIREVAEFSVHHSTIVLRSENDGKAKSSDESILHQLKEWYQNVFTKSDVLAVERIGLRNSVPSRDSESDAGPSGENHRFTMLAKAKREDLREAMEEERDHSYKGKRKWVSDLDGELSNSSTDSEPVAAKRPDYDGDIEPSRSAAQKMMEKMGYKEGTGLGKLKQGAVEPVAFSTQRGRVGLGHEITKSVGRDLTVIWDESKEEKTVEEHVDWLPECSERTRAWVVENLKGSEWIQIGEKKMKIDGETEFCDGEILRTMIKSKEVFDVIPDRDLREARARANPYETIGRAFFLNRAAMNVANLDKVFDFLLSGETEEKLLRKNPLTSDRPNSNCDREAPLFYFADVCGGPGGFSEYMLWRKAFYNAKGFGFTLKGKDDFKLGKFTASSAYYFEPYYGVHGDGDVLNPDNINALEEFVMKGTNNSGVNLMMADGGFSVEGNENIQEILSKRLYLCQFLVSLCIVRKSGVFFCKLFDIFTPFSVGLIYLMYVAYEKVSLHKPHNSRPANSERYIICKGLRKDYSVAVRDYLKRVNLKLDEFAKSNSSQDVISIVPVRILHKDQAFSSYLRTHNERLAVRQSTYLQKYLTFMRNKWLIDKEQGILRDECLKYWLVPNKSLSKVERGADRQQIDPDNYFGRFTKKIYGREDFNARLPQFTMDLLTERIPKQLKYAEFSLNILSNRATTQPELLISTGDAVFVWKKYWEKLGNNIMRIPDRTVLLVERAATYKLVENSLKVVKGDGLIRILDAAVINGDDVSALLYSKRMAAAKKFCNALKLVIPEVRLGWGDHVRYVTPLELVTAETFTFNQLAQVRRRFSRLRHNGEEVLVYEENGYLIMCKALRVARLLKESWNMGWSCTHSMNYAFCPPQPERCYEPQWEKHECCSSFWESSMPSKQGSRIPMQFIWSWENSLLDNYGPRVILEYDSHKNGPTVNSILREVDEIDKSAKKKNTSN